MWSVEFSDTALKGLRRMPANLSARIRAKLEQLARDPRAPNPQVKPIVGKRGVFRLRVGDWRVFYRLEGDCLVVFVMNVEPRGSAYD